MSINEINPRVSSRPKIRNNRPKTARILCLAIFALLCSTHAWGVFYIVRNGNPSCSIVLPENPTRQENFAAGELRSLVGRFTERELEQKSDSEPLPSGNVILLGTPDSNRHLGELSDRGLVLWRRNSNAEEFLVKTISDGDRQILVVVGEQDRGLIYGVYALVEKMIEGITESRPADLDFYTNTVNSLSVEDLNFRSAPFYPVRCSLEVESPTWMSRHRVNISGAEGVWSGTGIDDGLGTAFKYVQYSRFNSMQDESPADRRMRITLLQGRLAELDKRGIDSYLFMYVMGEPTKAMMRNHPELLDDAVQYSYSRNGVSYRPISWTNPEARELIMDLVRSIVRTYSPYLTGFHLRSWGWETRAPAGDNEELQKQLWDIYFDIIRAAREVDPDFKFLISGYDQSWLRDPDRIYASGLPEDTIFMHKWGVDGEPTNNPDIGFSYINSIGENGHRILIFSHNTEEVMPLWMLEADMFVEGVRKYADEPNIIGLGGFTLQGNTGLSHLDKIISARIGWDPYEDYIALMQNYLKSYYGEPAAQNMVEAIRINSLTMADYFSDFAGSLSVTGRYGTGSRGYATRFWNLIGADAVQDTLSLPDLETAEYAKERFASLLPRQQEAANEMADAGKKLQPVTNRAEQDYLDAMHLMKMWVRFFESRLRLVESKEAGLREKSREHIAQKLASAVEYSREMQIEIDGITRFTHVFGYNDASAKESLIIPIDEEIDFLKNFDPEDIITVRGQDEETEESELDIQGLVNYPNPMGDRADFCYTLTSSADEVTITIYTLRGKLIKTIENASARSGYNEEHWQAKDDNGRELANGTYIYKMVIERGDEKIQKIDKLSIVR